MYKKILVATDGSENSKHAMNYAMETAAKWNAELLILTVIPRPLSYVTPLEGSPAYIPQLDEDLKNAYSSINMQAAETVMKGQPEVEVRRLLKRGRPKEVILEVADEEDVDLVIVGSRGLGGISGWVLGSTSRHVIECCKKPVLIVK